MPPLPNRFPIGTKLVIESRPTGKGKPVIYSRYLEMPDGRSFSLPSRKPTSAVHDRLRRRRK